MKDTICKLFHLSSEESTLFLSHFSSAKFCKDDVFLEKGKVCNKVGLIEKGLMACIYDKKGEEVIEEFAYEDSFITDYYSLVKQTPSLKEIRCLEDTLVHVITRQGLEMLASKHAFIERMAMIMNEKLFFKTQDRLKSLLLDDATERYEKLIAQRADLVQRVPQYLLASYLNIRPETISRIRKKNTDLS